MRVNLGQAGGPSFVPINYPGFGPMPSSSPTITLYDGTVVNPATTKATAAQCLAYQCGIDSDNAAAIQWCAQSGQVGAFGCGDVECAPLLALMNCAVPAVGGPAPPQAAPVLPVLTPQNITQPLPDITSAVAPVAVAQSCSLWCDLNGAIAANPLMAVLILAGGAFLLWPKGKR
jgi:hypothetical protein